jgi:preprotein translocase subunit SecA
MITRVIEKSQRKVEAHNFDIRKHLLEFDDTANDQRKVIYEQRNELLDSESVAENITNIRYDVFSDLCRRSVPPDSVDEQWDLPALDKALESDYGLRLNVKSWAETQTDLDSDNVSENIVNIRYDVFSDLCRRFVPPDTVDEQWDLASLDRALETEYGLRLNVKPWAETQSDLDSDGVRDYVVSQVDRFFSEKEATYGTEIMRAAEKFFLLQVLDQHWKEHLASMDYLRQGIYLRGYAQKQPKQEFKREAFELFQAMLERVKAEVVMRLTRMRIQSESEVAALEEKQRREAERRALEFQHAEAEGLAAGAVAESDAQPMARAPAVSTPVMRDQPKVGRNDPCPCGSGRKYKQCHGKLA